MSIDVTSSPAKKEISELSGVDKRRGKGGNEVDASRLIDEEEDLPEEPDVTLELSTYAKLDNVDKNRDVDSEERKRGGADSSWPGRTPEGRVADLTLGPDRKSEGISAKFRHKVTEEEKIVINEAGQKYGCSTCPAKKSGWSDGHWTGDHQPPAKLAPEGPWTLYPQCRTCVKQQGGIVNAMNQHSKK